MTGWFQTFYKTWRVPLLAGFVFAGLPLALLGLYAWSVPSGFFFNGECQYDLFCYIAHARSLFERGNGFAHPNPFDPSLSAPVIYSHLFPLLAGWIWKITGLSPLFGYAVVRIVSGMVFAAAVWVICRTLFSDRVQRLFAFWGILLTGGYSLCRGMVSVTKKILAVWMSGSHLPSIDFWAESIRRIGIYEKSSIWWLINIFRNFFYATEILYHALFFLTLAFLMTRRYAAALFFFGLTLYAHPFTGLHLGLVVIGYGCWSFACDRRDGKALLPWSLAIGVFFAAFLFYNFIWLRGFPSHRELMMFWQSKMWVVGWGNQVFAYGFWLWGGLIGLLLHWRRYARDPGWRMVLVLLGVSLALANHHLLLPVHAQPAHFCRGYIFFCLVLFSVDALWQWPRARRFQETLARPLGMFVVVALLSLDNAAFLSLAVDGMRAEPQTITRDAHDVLDVLAAISGNSIVAATDETIGYLTPVFTAHRALIGHDSNTPRVDEKREALRRYVLLGDTAALASTGFQIDLLVLTQPDLAVFAHYPVFSAWREIYRNSSYHVFRNAPHSSP